MKLCESFLAEKITEYIAYRKERGYKDKNLKYWLCLFDQYLKNNGNQKERFTPSFFLAFRASLKAEPGGVNNIICAVRGFFQFLVRREIVPENPLQDIPTLPSRAYIPFVFSPQQIERLLTAIQKRIRPHQRYFFKDLTGYVALVLLAQCGLRISEPLRLLRTHYFAKEAAIYIENTKFHKDRLIPIPKSAVTHLKNYLAARESLLSQDHNPYLLAGIKQNRFPTHNLYVLFRQAVKDIGLSQPKKVWANTTFAPPTPHSLRHSFAINTLKRIKERGGSAQNALPILATYMGHKKYSNTAVYLKVLDAEQHQRLVDFSKYEDL